MDQTQVINLRGPFLIAHSVCVKQIQTMDQTQVINLRDPFFIAHSVFSNVYIVTKGKVKVNIKCSTVS